MDRKGEITVFLAMILVGICALLSVLVESARTAGARCSQRMAVNGSMDSLMSQYHRELWKKYRILGLEYEKAEQLEGELEAFFKEYLQGENWYPMVSEGAEARDIVTLTEGEGHYMEREILEYMTYGMAGAVWDTLTENEAENCLKSWKEGNHVSHVSQLYSSHTKGALEVEKALESINSSLSHQVEEWEKSRDALEAMDGNGFMDHAQRMIKELKELPRLVDLYEKRADQLERKLQESRKEFQSEQEALGEGARAALEDEIGRYESYVASEGERRREIANLKPLSSERIRWVEGMIQDVRSVVEYIDDWQPEDQEDELDQEALWSPVRLKWENYRRLSLGVEFGVEDKEKEKLLEKIGDLAEGGLLDLVLPEGTVLSKKNIDLKEAPSQIWRGGKEREKGAGGFGRESSAKEGLKGVRSLVDRVMIGEYALDFFEKFEKEIPEDSFYELEYILQGKVGDKENLAGVAALLVTVRQGLNLTHILSDSAKRQEARALATAMVGATGFLPLVSLVSFFVMAVWALGEALVDVRNLLNGGEVPLLKTREEWNLGLEGLLELGRNQCLGSQELDSNGLINSGRSEKDGKGKGTNYRGYLRMLILAQYAPEMVYRMMDAIQINIRKKQPGFAINQCACMVDMEVKVSGKHVFFSTGLWKTMRGDSSLRYQTRMEVSGSYLEGE